MFSGGQCTTKYTGCVVLKSASALAISLFRIFPGRIEWGDVAVSRPAQEVSPFFPSRERYHSVEIDKIQTSAQGPGFIMALMVSRQYPKLSAERLQNFSAFFEAAAERSQISHVDI